MSDTHLYSSCLSANDLFKARYMATMRWSLLGALLCTSLMVWFSPRYTPQPYQLRHNVMQITEYEIIYEIPETPTVAPPPVVMPNIEAALEDDPEAVEFIDDPTWVRFPGQTRIIDHSNDPAFVPSSAKPRLVSQAKPHYPEVARLAQIEGTVVVKVLVDVDGRVKQAALVNGVHPLLNKAALKAAYRCVFLPGKQREMKVETWVAVPYNFRLR